MQALTKTAHAAPAAAMVLCLTWIHLRNIERHQEHAPTSIKQSCLASVSSPFSLPSSIVFPIHTTSCDTSRQYTAENIPTPSRFRRTLAALHLRALPLPRKLVQNDPVFSDAALKRGLKQRAIDEYSLRKLQEELIKAVHEKRDTNYVRGLHEQFCLIAYGKGVKPQMREDFVIRYGCTGWTDEVLDELINLAEWRGFVEIGAGNGQWARALAERYSESGMSDDNNRAFDFVLAYDNMSELPLSPEIYHEHTQPAHDYFYSRVRKCESIESVLRQWSCRGRVLLLVYPSPGSMAIDAVKAYAELGPENDTVVYVGEGRGGANANDALFDYFESGNWAILQILPVNPQPGGKGYEKLYVLRKIKSNDESNEFIEG